ncbi:HlyC/CorC family transporter [Alphaproteobacteria bacterium KMM 3653]|uniref:HlyC/CorC family transporter n=1 Tax=Harenicola maris TaxID=2841044 RepID=A0AAP2G536_9RHOB|nr:HlyC/CorC family transporter [Harenicola maris]
MSDEIEGSSSAAQGAQDTETPPQDMGLLGRLAWALSPNSTETDEEETGAPRNGSAVPGVGNLRAMRVEDVAIPKVEIVAVPADIELADLIETFRDSGFSRLPVFDGTLDTPMGMVHLKDVALKHGFNGNGGPFSLAPMLRPLIYAPPSMPIGVLLQKMQTERMHMALVIDEYGGTDGLVTIEDLIEQVIGEIEDEHDTSEDAYWVQEKPGCYLAVARTPLDEFQAEIGMTLVEGEDVEEVDTLGGLAFMLTGRVPTRGEVIPHPAGVQIEVVDADPRRIKRLRVRLPSDLGVRAAAEEGAEAPLSETEA